MSDEDEPPLKSPTGAWEIVPYDGEIPEDFMFTCEIPVLRSLPHFVMTTQESPDGR